VDGLDALTRWYAFNPSIRCSVGQLISSFLSQARSAATRPIVHVLSTTVFDRLHTINESSLDHAITAISYRIASSSPTLSINHDLFNGIYIFTALHLRIKCLFSGLDKSFNSYSNYNSRGTMLPSQNLPIQVSHTCTAQRSPSHCLLANAPTTPPFALTSLLPFHQTVLKRHLQHEPRALSFFGRIHSAPVRRHTLEFVVLSILASRRRVGNNEDGGHARGGRLAALSSTWL